MIVSVVSQPQSISLSASTTAVSCNGDNNGAINLSVNGGTSPYSYMWTGGATTQDISGKAAGNYSVTVTDNNGVVDDE